MMKGAMGGPIGTGGLMGGAVGTPVAPTQAPGGSFLGGVGTSINGGSLRDATGFQAPNRTVNLPGVGSFTPPAQAPGLLARGMEVERQNAGVTNAQAAMQGAVDQARVTGNTGSAPYMPSNPTFYSR